MVEILDHTSPLLTVRITTDTHAFIYTVFGVLKIDDYLIDSLNNLIERYGLAEGLRDWIYYNHFSVVSTNMEPSVAPIREVLRGKPALSNLFDRLSFYRWETVTEEDERNLQRLQEILIDHRVEIERPRGEKKARLKRISDNLVG